MNRVFNFVICNESLESALVCEALLASKIVVLEIDRLQSWVTIAKIMPSSEPVHEPSLCNPVDQTIGIVVHFAHSGQHSVPEIEYECDGVR